MTLKSLLSKPWMRVVIFLWMIVFPIGFIGIPVAQMTMGEAAKSWTPLWALVIWLLGPWVVSVVIKSADNSDESR